MKRISVIVITYNSETYIRDCLNSVKTHLLDCEYEIVVADNLSQDKTKDIIYAEFPEVKLIAAPKNLGFAAANNLAVKNAEGELLLLLNHDAQLLEPINKAISLIEQKKEIGVVGLKMLDANENYAISVGKFPKAWQLLKFTWFNEKSKQFLSGNFSDPENICNVDWLSGALLLVDRSLYNEVGGMDEDFFMYVEDVDFCKKVWNTGRRVVFYPKLSYLHHIGFSKSREIHLINGYSIFAYKYFKGLELEIAKRALQLNHGIKKIKNGLR